MAVATIPPALKPDYTLPVFKSLATRSLNDESCQAIEAYALQATGNPVIWGPGEYAHLHITVIIRGATISMQAFVEHEGSWRGEVRQHGERFAEVLTKTLATVRPDSL